MKKTISLALLLLAAIAAHADEDVYSIKRCDLPTELEFDQVHHDRHYLPSFPINVYVSGKFSKQWAKQIFRAVAEWNKFSRASFGGDFFVIKSGLMPAFASKKSADFQINTPVKQPTSTLAIIPDVLDGVHGVTNVETGRLYPGFSPVRKIQGLMKISTCYSTELGAVPGDSPQIASIALHEMGHALNLDHTCDGTNGKDGTNQLYLNWSCGDVPHLDRGEEIKNSVMYPGLHVYTDHIINGKVSRVFDLEIKDKLTRLDTMRAYCLYEGLDLTRASSTPAVPKL